MYAGGVWASVDQKTSPRNSLSNIYDPLSSAHNSSSSARNSLSSTRDSLTPPPPSLKHTINGRLMPPLTRGTTLSLPPAPPFPSPSDSMWTDDDDERETIYEDAVSMLSGVYYF